MTLVEIGSIIAALAAVAYWWTDGNLFDGFGESADSSDSSGGDSGGGDGGGGD